MTVFQQSELQEINESIDMPSKNHSWVQSNLHTAIGVRYQQYKVLPQLSVRLEGIPTIPDLCVFVKENSPNWRHDELEVNIPPLAIIEILSPKQGVDDLITKFDNYFKSGVKSCWLVDPLQKTIHVYKPDFSQSVYIQGVIKDTVTNIEVPIEEIFD